MGFTIESLARVAIALGMIRPNTNTVTFELHQYELIKPGIRGWAGFWALHYRVHQEAA